MCEGVPSKPKVFQSADHLNGVNIRGWHPYLIVNDMTYGYEGTPQATLTLTFLEPGEYMYLHYHNSVTKEIHTNINTDNIENINYGFITIE